MNNNQLLEEMLNMKKQLAEMMNIIHQKDSIINQQNQKQIIQPNSYGLPPNYQNNQPLNNQTPLNNAYSGYNGYNNINNINNNNSYMQQPKFLQNNINPNFNQQFLPNAMFGQQH